ncbi:MAG: T9SS type A sorting domain-containing protein [Cytophagales bacterium]|nr:T9SS type A sorting domain-containing protein [Cytophagales bacterium]
MGSKLFPEQTHVYPNPTQDVLNIQSASQINRVQLLNMSGQIVFDKECNSDNLQIMVDHLHQGMYQLFLNNIPVRKVMLNHYESEW